MADEENAMPVSKKRAAGREISKDNPGLDDDDDENVSEQELGTFKKASDEVLAKRRIVKVRRQTSSSAPTTANPFAGIQLAPPKAVSDTLVVAAPVATDALVLEVVKESEVAEDKANDVAVEKADKDSEEGGQNNAEEGNVLGKNEAGSVCENVGTVAEVTIPSEKETVEVKDSSTNAEGNKPDKVYGSNVEECDEANKVGETCRSDTLNEKDQSKVDGNSSGTASNINPFLQLSGSKNAFTGFTGTGFSGPAFSFIPISNDGTAAGVCSVPSTGHKTDQPLFNFGLSASSGNGSLFGTKNTPLTKSDTASTIPSLQEVPTETGEENERVIFSANSALFEYLDGSWKERGRGEIKVNVSTLDESKTRLVMRTRGNLRLILNASLYPEMKLTYMDKKGITFACVNSNGEAKGTLATYALKFKDGVLADEFHTVVTKHKGSSSFTTTSVLKTPENSPQ